MILVVLEVVSWRFLGVESGGTSYFPTAWKVVDEAGGEETQQAGVSEGSPSAVNRDLLLRAPGGGASKHAVPSHPETFGTTHGVE